MSFSSPPGLALSAYRCLCLGERGTGYARACADPQVTSVVVVQLGVIIIFNGFLTGLRLVVAEEDDQWWELGFGIGEGAAQVFYLLGKLAGPLEVDLARNDSPVTREKYSCWCHPCLFFRQTWPWWVAGFALLGYIGVLVVDVVVTLVEHSTNRQPLAILDVATLLPLLLLNFGDLFQLLRSTQGDQNERVIREELLTDEEQSTPMDTAGDTTPRAGDTIPLAGDV